MQKQEIKNSIMKLILSIATIVLFTGCASSQNNKPQDKKLMSENKIPAGNPVKAAGREAVAYFSEGCFWHTEIVFQSLDGVRDAVSGYSGGSLKNPDYET